MSIRTRTLLLPLLLTSLPSVSAEPLDHRQAYELLLATIETTESLETELTRFLAATRQTEWELQARVVTAEMAYRRGQSELAKATLEQAKLTDRKDYLAGYARYVLGLVGPAEEASRQFTAAYELAGNSLLRHRAGLWLAEEAVRASQPRAALELLGSLADTQVEPGIAADLLVRRAMIQETLGLDEEATAALRDLWLQQPQLAYKAETRELFELVDSRLKSHGFRPTSEQQLTRVERLLDARLARQAVAEARAWRPTADAPTDRHHLLLARAELEGGSTARAIASLARIPSSSSIILDAQLVRARALLRLRKQREAEKLFAQLAAAPDAGQVRVEAAAVLADRLEDKSVARAVPLWKIVATEGEPGSLADAGAWFVAWEAYGRSDYAEATAWFGILMSRSPEPIHVARGAYWAGRSLAHLQRQDEATVMYQAALASDRLGYYGLLATARLAPRTDPSGTPKWPAVDDPLRVSPPEVLAALVPAQTLLSLGLFDDAIAELEYQNRRFPDEPAPRALLAEVYHGHGDYQSSVRWLARAFPNHQRAGLPSEYLTRLYPLSQWGTILEQAKRESIDPYLLAAVIYQESRFAVTAHSSAGARGLMQIMPSTGKEIARKLRDSGFDTSQLYEPERNIRYGSHYLRKLIDQHDGSTAKALAAYNAGGSRVKRWSRGEPREIDEFIESIPFRETRLYVKNILVAHRGYHQAYDDQPDCPLMP